MLEKSITKIQNEMDQNKSNSYIQYVGEFLKKHITANPSNAEKILTTDKTIAKSLDAMRKVAETKKVGNMAMLTPPEGLEVVLKYFGITGAPGSILSVDVVASPKKQVTEVKSGIDFDINLEDLI